MLLSVFCILLSLEKLDALDGMADRKCEESKAQFAVNPAYR